MPEDFLLEAFPVSRAECGRVEKAYGFLMAFAKRISAGGNFKSFMPAPDWDAAAGAVW